MSGNVKPWRVYLLTDNAAEHTIDIDNKQLIDLMQAKDPPVPLSADTLRHLESVLNRNNDASFYGFLSCVSFVLACMIIRTL